MMCVMFAVVRFIPNLSIKEEFVGFIVLTIVHNSMGYSYKVFSFIKD